MSKKASTKKKPTYNQTSAIRSALRRSFSRSPIVREVLHEGRREVPRFKKDGSLAAKPGVEYCCQVCGSWVNSTKIAVDHIDPVVPPDGSFDPQNPDWNLFISRLWCDKSNLQRICEPCHHAKTQAERLRLKELRDFHKQKQLTKIIME